MVKWIIGLVAFALLSSAASATTVNLSSINPTFVLSVNNLLVDGTVYDVDFRILSTSDVYADPSLFNGPAGGFDFSDAGSAEKAAVALQNALQEEYDKAGSLYLDDATAFAESDHSLLPPKNDSTIFTWVKYALFNNYDAAGNLISDKAAYIPFKKDPFGGLTTKSVVFDYVAGMKDEWVAGSNNITPVSNTTFPFEDQRIFANFEIVTTVPIPAAAWLFASALGIFSYAGWRKKSA
jgi:hypothetical protein